jgi:hypothetical protein
MRTYPRNSFERCVQVLRWLNEEFQIAEDGAWRLEFVDFIQRDEHGKESILGMVTEKGGKLVITVSAAGRFSRSHAIETVIHEAAHCKLWDTGRGLQHGPEFWKVFGRMMDAYDHHGREDSKSYYVD